MLALGIISAIFVGIIVLHRHAKQLGVLAKQSPFIPFQTIFPRRPISWLAIRSINPERVQAALGLGHFVPCSWSEGMSGEHEFFISPRVNGWVIITGLAIPTPDDDVDECFRFLAALSRKLGHVQYFFAEQFSQHHAWARMDHGCVTRAYAWAGETIWNQGAKTLPENELDMKCFDYGEDCPSPKIAEKNSEKVALLAARWSLDPAAIDERFLNFANGIAGELPQIF
jgi:hypothetical protein